MKKLMTMLAAGALFVVVQPAAMADAGCCPGSADARTAKEAKTEARADCSTEKKSDCDDKSECTDTSAKQSECTRG